MKGRAGIFSIIGQMSAKMLASNYLVIASVAALCLFPVYSGYFSLKYDNIAFDLPIHYFLGEQIVSGEMPIWFNTWNMGFPMQSVFCWGVFSTIFLTFSIINFPDPSIFHFELVFFVALAGMTFYKLLKHFATTNRQMALLLACIYMLSGFTFGSSQWIFYLSGMALMPLCIYFLLQLLNRKSFKYACLFPVSYLVLFTNTHIFLSVVCTYLVAGIVVFHAIYAYRKTELDFYPFLRKAAIPAASFLLLIIVCLAPVWYSLELLPYLERSTPIIRDRVVFQSNFMHPAGLITLVLPQAAIKWQFENTEGMMQSVYMGILTPFLAVLAIRHFFKNPDAINKVLVIGSLFFLLVSFGHFLPLREALNFLPGFSYFRHPGLFRLFFIGFLMVFIARSTQGDLVETLSGENNRKIMLYFGAVFLLVIISGLVLGAMGSSGWWKGSLTETIKEMDSPTLLFMSSLVQLFLLFSLWLAWRNRSNLLRPLIFFDLMLNGLLCLPFHTISSIQLDHLSTILMPVKGDPVQSESPSSVLSYFIDANGTRWEHYNSSIKKVSTDVDRYNPLMGAKVNAFLQDTSLRKMADGQPLVFFHGFDPSGNADLIAVIEQQPTSLRAKMLAPVNDTLCIQQMYFPGWKVYKNESEVPILENTGTPYVSAKMELNKGDTVSVVYQKPWLVFWSLLLNGVVYLTLLFALIFKFRYKLMPFIR